MQYYQNKIVSSSRSMDPLALSHSIYFKEIVLHFSILIITIIILNTLSSS